MARVVAILVAAAALGLNACRKPVAADPSPKAAAPASALCSDAAVPEQLKAAIFRAARAVRARDPAAVDALAGRTTARVEGAAAQGRDDGLDAALCSARLVIGLPEGTADALNGAPDVSASVRYAVQAGQPLRLQLLGGAEALSFRLASVGLARDSAAAVVPPRSTPAPTAPDRPPPPSRVAAARSPRPSPPAAVAPPSWPAAEPRLSARGRPSFDCRAARSSGERLVCGDERLAALDRVADGLYDRALSRAGRRNRPALRDSQDDFLARRDRCRDPACVARAYQERLDEIDLIAGRR